MLQNGLAGSVQVVDQTVDRSRQPAVGEDSSGPENQRQRGSDGKRGELVQVKDAAAVR